MMLKGKAHWEAESLSREQRVRLLNGYYALTKMWEVLPSQPPILAHSGRCPGNQRCTKAFGQLWKYVVDMAGMHPGLQKEDVLNKFNMMEGYVKALVAEREGQAPGEQDGIPNCRESAVLVTAHKPSAPSSTRSAADSQTPNDSPSDENAPRSQFVLAMHDFEPQAQNVACLPFNAGQIITVLNRDPSGWWDGELDGRRGWFPSNYVTADAGMLTEEDLPRLTRACRGHAHSMSSASAASWATPAGSPTTRSRSFSRTDHRPLPADSDGTAVDPYCPPLMIPLLHGLSLLQNAAKLNRITHFQPSTAYIISCVRAILADVGCLQREAPNLKRHGILGQERKRILSDLASLVSQAKKASAPEIIEDDELREVEVETMVRLGGQLFAHVRGFLALIVQCGINIPIQGGQPPGTTVGKLHGRWGSSDGTAVQSDDSSGVSEFGQRWGPSEKMAKMTNGVERRSSTRKGDTHSVLSTPLRARSMGDLKTPKQAISEVDIAKMPLVAHHKSLAVKGAGYSTFSPRTRKLVDGTIARHKASHQSVSSQSSSSSFSSANSITTPATPAFPSGPSTATEVVEALRYTHDNYLSTIAAFIGHAHSHSRTSHASSTGHMYDLVREVVDMVCRLLTIVEAVLKHPEIPAPRTERLKAAKEGLYNATSKLADSVRLLTMPPSPDVSEEEEKITLLRCATNALKAGSDCVSAVKKCLQRPTGERPFVIQLPSPGEIGLPTSPGKFSNHVNTHVRAASKSSSMHALRDLYASQGMDAEEEDLTIQAQTDSSVDVTVRVDRSSGELKPSAQAILPNPWQPPETPTESIAESTLSSASFESKALPPLRIINEGIPSDLPSPVSLAPTDDDRTTWEGSSQKRAHSPMSFEEKLVNGDLPP
ncbi:hypothetical protein POSPLADRAFT_1104169, partial [Postia placenta MAD-698-R-SB12]